MSLQRSSKSKSLNRKNGPYQGKWYFRSHHQELQSTAQYEDAGASLAELFLDKRHPEVRWGTQTCSGVEDNSCQ